MEEPRLVPGGDRAARDFLNRPAESGRLENLKRRAPGRGLGAVPEVGEERPKLKVRAEQGDSEGADRPFRRRLLQEIVGCEIAEKVSREDLGRARRPATPPTTLHRKNRKGHDAGDLRRQGHGSIPSPKPSRRTPPEVHPRGFALPERPVRAALAEGALLSSPARSAGASTKKIRSSGQPYLGQPGCGVEDQPGGGHCPVEHPGGESQRLLGIALRLGLEVRPGVTPFAFLL